MEIKIKKITATTHIKGESAYVSSVLEYDENQNETLSVNYTLTGELDGKEESRYDAAGNKIENLHYFTEDEVSNHHFFEFNADNRLLKERISYADGSETIRSYARDTQNNAITITSVDDEGDLEEKEIVKLDAENRMLEQTIWDEDELIKEHHIIERDDDGRVVKMINLDEHGKTISQTLQEFNQAGNITKRISLNAKGALADSVLYSYDEQNRLIETKVGSRLLIKNEHNDEKGSETEIRVNASGMVEDRNTTYLNEHGRITKEEGLDANIEYEYEYY